MNSVDSETAPETPELLSHREIAAQLGIGRARVFFHEHAALAKIRKALAAQGIATQNDFECAAMLRDLPAPQPQQRQLLERYSSLHGWLRVGQIVSLNDGCVIPLEIAQAFKLLKASHSKLVRPPLVVTTSGGVKSEYRIEAAAVHHGTLRVRCWPNECAPRTVESLTPFPCTAIVESIFDCDDGGEFDVPMLDCVIVSARKAKGFKK